MESSVKIKRMVISRTIRLLFYVKLDVVEHGKCLDDIGVIHDTAGLADGMHGPHGIADIYTAHFHLRKENVTESGASSHVGMVHEFLVRYPGHVANGGEHCRRIPVGDVFLVGVELDDRAAVDDRMIGRVVFLHVVGVKGMSHIGRYHEAVVDGPV